MNEISAELDDCQEQTVREAFGHAQVDKIRWAMMLQLTAANGCIILGILAARLMRPDGTVGCRMWCIRHIMVQVFKCIRMMHWVASFEIASVSLFCLAMG